MIVSWNWLKQYVPLDMPIEEAERRLMMAGLNHESTAEVGGDLAIDLEVTSNRPDCLGHIGVAREIAVLFGRPLSIPKALPDETGPAVESLLDVAIECPRLCTRYTARLVQGVKIGPSPEWMRQRLAAIGVTAINNVVDVTNYVLFECGQPLHAFDFAGLRGRRIVVREPRPGETIEAIDHKEYALSAGMCVIGDGERAVAIGGVMGGAATEIGPETTDVLVEAAEFDPVSIRSTSRTLGLASDSSYRFERGVDSHGIDWASRRCCELILEAAGGVLCQGVVDVGPRPKPREAVVLRFAQLKRILGIEVPPERVRDILSSLGNAVQRQEARRIEVIPPTWRRDLTREADLIEEVARIHGYEEIPEDVSVPMAPSSRRLEDRVLAKVRQTLCALGFDEAVTPSVVDAAASEAFSPWTDVAPLATRITILRGADRLRRSLVPSLLAARKINEALSNPDIELFEIARVYLPHEGPLPREPVMLAVTSGRGFREVKGAVEALLDALGITAELQAAPCGQPPLDPAASCHLALHGETLGYLGEIQAEGLKQFDLRSRTCVAELKIEPLIEAACLVPRYTPLTAYPAVSRDLNLVVDEAVRWADVAATVRAASGEPFEGLDYLDTYRDLQRIGAGRKSLLMSLTLRSREGTMTNQQADAIRDRIVAACRQAHNAELR